MNRFRRAAPDGASPHAHAAEIRAAIGLLSGALAVVAGTWAAVSVAMARKVVAPPPPRTDTRIDGVDVPAQTITLQRTPDTELPGRYGLFTSGSVPYVKVGTVLSVDARSVRRKLLTEVDATMQLAPDAAFSGWYYDKPDQLHLPYRDELVGTPVGPCPAWLFPAEGADTWVIQVHGWGTRRAECLRAVPVLHALGLTVLVASYRNDSEAPRTRSGMYQLGATEWRDVDAAVGFARRHGARHVLLMGWSMGGAIALQTELNTAHPDILAGLILDSPVVDWRSVLGYQAGLMHLPDAVTGTALHALQAQWAKPLTGGAVPLDRLDAVARAAELMHPILILHSDDDGFVPSDGSHALAAARPDLVTLETFHGARHTKLWNYDPERWSGAIGTWVRVRGLAVPAR